MCRGKTYRVIFTLLYGLGLRVGEVARLCVGDVDLTRDLLVIRETKFYKSRLVPFGPGIARVLTAIAPSLKRDAAALRRPAVLLVASSAESVGRQSMGLAGLSWFFWKGHDEACGSCAKPSAVLQRPVGAFSASTGLAASTRAAPRRDASRVDSERMVVTTLTRISETNGGMQIKTILNRIQKQRGFVYGTVQLEEQIGGLALTVDLAPHRRNRPQCSGCGQRGRVYDRLAPRRFEFVPLWGLRVFFLYTMRRVDCAALWRDASSRCRGPTGSTSSRRPTCGFSPTWAKRLSWQEVARVFRTSWDQVFRSVAMAVAWGRDHVDLHRHSRDRHRRDPLAARARSFSRSSIRSTRRASGCCGSASTGAPRPCSGSFAGSARSGPPRSRSSAATCGSPI